ncbi:MAG: FAD-dependent oxidoreductase [Acidimicrobiales bacterium]|nr:FAD-dependent oxidoreductase [Acidimicrobiales bacterium]
MTSGAGWADEALAGARPTVFWTDDDPPPPRPLPDGDHEVDLAIVGGGFTGLWAAVQAAERHPGRRIAVLEAEGIGFGASSRNGGFADSSLTHGLGNGASHWPDEIDQLVRLGRANLAGLVDDVARLGIECDLTPSGELTLADAAWQAEDLARDVALHERHGIAAELLDEAATRDHLRSPRFVAAMWRPDDVVLVHPARLVRGLAEAAEAAGCTVAEGCEVRAIDDDGAALVVRTDRASVRADRVLVATNAYRGPLRRPRRWIVPVYDHALMTEPLDADQLAAIGWGRRQGASDAANRFHYFRLTADDRILWGGFEPTYHRGNGVDPAHDQSDVVHPMLARHFFATFPQLEGVRFTHRWGGPIGTTSRFTATWGTDHDGRLAWVGGYTGLGVAATRFASAVALDLLDGEATERTELAMVRRPPVPFPPEPLRSVGIALTKRAVQRADEHDGRPGWWLRTLDRFGVGFDF